MPTIAKRLTTRYVVRMTKYLVKSLFQLPQSHVSHQAGANF